MIKGTLRLNPSASCKMHVKAFNKKNEERIKKKTGGDSKNEKCSDRFKVGYTVLQQQAIRNEQLSI